MSFTSLSTIKKHLLDAALPPVVIEDLPITLNGTESTQLPHRSLVEASDRVKLNKCSVPLLAGPINLSGTTWAQIPDTELVPASVVIAASANLSTLYSEQVDYQVDYVGGRVRRIDGGVIGDGRNVYVFYERYYLFSRDDDYRIDLSKGLLERADVSRIPDGATILVDYTVSSGSVGDALVLQAIVEAEDRIVRALSPEYNASSMDQGLQTGATELALSIIARDMAAATLGQWRSSDAPSRAKEWQALSALYEARAFATLAPFLAPHGLHSPILKTNG